MPENLPRIAIARPHKERYGDFIYGQLLEQIASGTFAVGLRLPSEKEFAALFGVSRPIIRQALTRLQADGVIESRQGSGTILRKIPPKGLMDVADGSGVADILRAIEARIPLESATAKFAAIRKSISDAERLTSVMNDLRKEFQTGTIRPEFDLAFHRTIAEICYNRHLEQLFYNLIPAIEAGVALNLGFTRLAPKQRAERILDEHERVYEAVMDGDGDSASLAMAYHLDQARRRLIDGSRRY